MTIPGALDTPGDLALCPRPRRVGILSDEDGAMRIVVMGAGGTGGYFGAKLARAGEDVTFVARGNHREAIQAHGLRVRSAVEGEWVVRAPAVEGLEGLPPADIVLFCVKSFDTESAAEVIRPVVGRDTGVLSVQNGVDNEEVLARRLGAEHVLGGVARVFSTIEAPGTIAHTLLGQLEFGEMDGAETPRARAFLAACRGAGIAAELSGRIRSALWEKYVFLVAHSAMTALTRRPAGILRELPETRRMYRLLLEEMAALARTEKAGLDEHIVDGAMRALDGLGAEALSSLYHDLMQGKRLEIESLQGHAVRLGARHGIPTTTLFATYALLCPHRDGSNTPA
jgi:2-dehydropantoate 2-reductase